MTMREKIARAMYENIRSRTPDSIAPLHAWENQSAALHADWLTCADAAFDVLTEPSKEMLSAGLDAVDTMAPHEAGCDCSPGSAWGAMIRAAKEGK